jgi:glycosyltransferase involved in cell wall biosynthesis
MRFALLIYETLDTVSGGYLYDRKLVKALEGRGDRVEILSLPWRDYARHLMDNFSPALLRRLEMLDVDALLEDELNHPSLFWIHRRLKRSIKIPVISIVHHLRSSEARAGWQNSLYRRVESSYLRSVDGFVFNSLTTRQAVEALAGRGKPCVVARPAGDRLIPNIDGDAIARRARSPGPLQVLFLGNLIPRKGLHVLLKALSRLHPDLWSLSVVGSPEADPSYAGSVRRQAQALGIAGRVRFLGPLSDADLSARMETSHVLAVPSSYEGYGIAYLEGMGFGLPAVAANSGAAGEVVAQGKTGFLIPPGDARALAGCLQTLAQDRNCLAAMGQAALESYRTHPTWDQSMELIVKFLHSGLKLRPPTADR